MNELRSESAPHGGRRWWMPKSISYAFGEPIVELAELEHAPGPFISDLDLQQARATRRVPLMDVPASELAACREPAGFLFHLPRSGSTLAARMLAAVPGVACVIEPEPINQLLSRGAPEALRAEWLQRLVRLYGAVPGAYPRIVVKLSSWAVLRAPLFAEAFPNARHCFVHRDPLEVLVQLLDRPTGWMAPHARPLVLGHPGASTPMTEEEYCARALGRFLCLAADCERMQTLAYEDIPAGVPAAAQQFLAFTVTPADADAMLRVARFDSDDWELSRVYRHDGDRLRRRATPEARRLVERFASAERRRLDRTGG